MNKILVLVGLAALTLFCVMSMDVLTLKHENTRLVTTVYQNQNQRDQLNLEWTQLMLQQNILSAQKEIERDVQAVMQSPEASNVVYLKP